MTHAKYDHFLSHERHTFTSYAPKELPKVANFPMVISHPDAPYRYTALPPASLMHDEKKPA